MATTTMAVGANILRGGAGSVRIQLLLSSFSAKFSNPSLSFSRSSLKLTTILQTPRFFHFHCQHPNINTNLSLSFCTSPATTPDTAAASTTSSSSDKDKDKDTDNNVNIKDAANMLDIRVGRIIKAWRHEEADSLYVEEVDVGEAEPRIICSGLVKYIPVDLLQDRKVIVLANLKPRNMRGVKSNGMLLAASDAAHENVELLEPPEDSLPGERIWFGSEEDKENQSAPATPNQIQKKKIWELVQPHLKTDDSCIAMLGEQLMQTSAGAVMSRSLKNANIS
ncbi:hypothetical protein Patl1_27159 [Pistacia atlantica]|uniref:Uncharacterized protein n=1 Tax=Pistacia atlantica TaxID=434234 RepID=A0ACC1B191_9ROSI|nr:hypothetical protein Patl1_27159 [Pistacia atlantica]